MKLTKQEVKKNIQHETISGTTISYSYALKSQATLSFMTNERLLIFNQNDGNLYYVNQPKSLPFKTQIPKPKNQVANVNVSIVKNPPATNDLTLQFVNKNQKNQNVAVQWTFTMDNKALAKEWLKVIQDYKANKIQKATGQTDSKVQPANNAFIHDTLGYGFMQGLKKEQKSPTKSQQPKRQPQKSPGLNQSKKPNTGSSNLLGNQLGNSNIRGSNTGLGNNKESDIRRSGNNSKISDGGSKLSPQKLPLSPQKRIENIRQSQVKINDVRQSNLGGSNRGQGQGQIRQSNIRGNQSPQIKRSHLIQQSRLNKSKLTLRDQLQSIMQRSQLRQSKFEQYGIDQSRISTRGYDASKDWNLKFLQKQQESVLLDFQEEAIKVFFKILPEDQKADKALRYYLQNQVVVYVSDARSLQARKLKAQYRNYHFIMQSCKENFIVGVPLACLIQFEGLVALVKSVIPQKAVPIDLTQQILLDLKDLQRYTRIKNNILKKADLYDLSQLYDSKGKRMIYINNLFEYLPVHIEQNFQGGFLRPQHILDNVNQFMQGGLAHEANRYDMRTLNQTLELIKNNVKKLAQQLSTQDILFANSIELKNIMHQRGINLKYLPMLYSELSNKNVKKYINTVMVAKVAKDDILQNLASLRMDSAKISMAETVQNSYRLLVEGNTSVSNEFWKQIAINFRKQYGIPMSNHDIVGPFFLNCLMKLIPAKYDLTKLNDKKVFFKDDGIINKGFIVDLVPKVKSFSRFTTQLTDKIDITCKEQKLRQNFQAIVQELELKSKPIPRNFQLSNVDQNLKQYLSFYTCPVQLDQKQQNSDSLRHLNLFDKVNLQPPTTLSLKITKNYLDWCLDREQLDKFKRTLQQSIIVIDFWFDPNHPYHCQFYQSLSNYYQLTGAVQESINFMKESLAIAIRSGGVTSKKTGYKYYELAEKQLRAGRKSDSMENFNKAKNNMENYNDKTIKYPITLMKLSSLYLNASDFEECVIYAKQAVQKFQELQKVNQSIAIPKGYYDQYCIKAIQVMTRAFQIQNKKAQFYRLAQLSSTKYNKTKNPIVFQQLVKICLTAVIFKHNQQKCQVYQAFLQKITLSQQSQQIRQKALDQLMQMAQQFNVMERFMFKFESLERFTSDINSRRALSTDGKEFISINRNILGLVGEDYVYGLIQQKQFE